MNTAHSTEHYILRTGIGRKVMEGSLDNVMKHVDKVRNAPGTQPILKLVKVTVLEEEIEHV
jgi:hypothetical protein